MIKEIKGEKQLHKYFNELKMKIYFSSTDVMNMTGISLRTLRYRIAELKEKYKGVKSLMFQKGNRWNIHNDIVGEFLPKYEPRWKNLYNINWQSFITWSTLNNYDMDYHKQIADELALNNPGSRFYYVLERTDNGKYHAHLLSTGDVKTIEESLRKILSGYIPYFEYRMEVSEVRNKVMAINYLQKEKYDERLY